MLAHCIPAIQWFNEKRQNVERKNAIQKQERTKMKRHKNDMVLYCMTATDTGLYAEQIWCKHM